MGCLNDRSEIKDGQYSGFQVGGQKADPTLKVKYSIGTVEKLKIEAGDILNQLLGIIKDRLKLKNKPTFERIFRASDHKFKASSFHQHCHNSKNTILIAYSDSKRWFGGFTPCPWKKGETLSYEIDQKYSSFLFTVIDNTIELFELKRQNEGKAIMNDDDYGPIFGEGHDLIIKDQCNDHFSWSNIGLSYTTKHSYGSMKSNAELTGNEKYLIREYEVWQLHI